MKIAFAIDRFMGIAGGAERVLCVLASGLAQRGHMVEILTADPEEGAPFYHLDPLVRIVRLSPAVGWRSRLAGKINNALHRFSLTRTWPGSYMAWYLIRRPLHRLFNAYLKQSQPDVGIAFMNGGIGLLGHDAPGFPRRKIASLHNIPAEELDLYFHPVFLYQRWVGIRAIKGFDRITVLWPDFIGGLPSDLRPRARAIPNIIPVSEAVTPWEAREPLVVAVSRLVSNKRIDVLITAWADVVSRFPAWRLEIYGEGPEETALQARIADLGLAGSVRLMGLTQDIDSVHDRARLMAHPSAFEGFPLAIGEALARGVPVIGFADCAGLNSLVQDGSNGRLVPPSADRAAALAGALADLLADSAMLQSLGENGPPSMATYSEAAILDQWEALLNEVMQEDVGSTLPGLNT